MNLRPFIPWLSWQDLPREDAAGMGFSTHHRYEVLSFEWFGFGIGFLVRVKK